MTTDIFFEAAAQLSGLSATYIKDDDFIVEWDAFGIYVQISPQELYLYKYYEKPPPEYMQDEIQQVNDFINNEILPRGIDVYLREDSICLLYDNVDIIVEEGSISYNYDKDEINISGKTYTKISEP